jgi:nucleoside-diphosphate-sugar epimerase
MLRVASSELEPVHAPPDWTAGSYRTGVRDKITRDLGWTPGVRLEEGLQRTYEWLKAARR